MYSCVGGAPGGWAGSPMTVPAPTSRRVQWRVVLGGVAAPSPPSPPPPPGVSVTPRARAADDSTVTPRSLEVRVGDPGRGPTATVRAGAPGRPLGEGPGVGVALGDEEGLPLGLPVSVPVSLALVDGELVRLGLAVSDSDGDSDGVGVAESDSRVMDAVWERLVECDVDMEVEREVEAVAVGVRDVLSLGLSLGLLDSEGVLEAVLVAVPVAVVVVEGVGDGDRVAEVLRESLLEGVTLVLLLGVYPADAVLVADPSSEGDAVGVTLGVRDRDPCHWSWTWLTRRWWRWCWRRGTPRWWA
jgi:hypothetical protein